MAWRYYLHRLNGDGTETVLHDDAPIVGTSYTKGAGGLDTVSDATIPVEFAALRGPEDDPIIEPWETILYVERDGVLLGCVIITDVQVHGQVVKFSGQSFWAYYKGFPVREPWGERRYWDTNPMEAINSVLTSVRNETGCNIGLTFDKDALTLPHTLGEAPWTVTDDPGVMATREGSPDGPYVIAWWNNPDVWAVVEDIAGRYDVTFTETHTRTASGGTHTLVPHVGIPGTDRRTTLKFRLGDNVLGELPAFTFGGDQWATDVQITGAGEGKTRRYAEIGQVSATLRRWQSLDDTSLLDYPELFKAGTDAYFDNNPRHGEVTNLTVVESDTTPLDSFGPGDTIKLVIPERYGWAPLFTHSRGADARGKWYAVDLEIVSITYTPDEDKATVAVSWRRI